MVASRQDGSHSVDFTDTTFGEGAGGNRQRCAALDQRHEFLSPIRRESGILVNVHPGLLSTGSNDLAATTFPRSAWVNNLLLRHN
jgi:hypothetical protein